MEIKLSVEIKKTLEARHRVERDGRVRDRIKAVLLKSEGWTNSAIAQALRISIDTVGQHLQDWRAAEKLKPENGGSTGKLNATQTAALDQHLQATLYTQVSEICGYVAKTWQVFYTVSGMTKWLKTHQFSYKQPKAVPAKADADKQAAFIAHYLNLKANTPATEPVVFVDAVHPTMATKISHGWIKKGVEKPIATIASRSRLNIIGAIELATMTVTNTFVETVNAETILTFFDQLKQAYPEAPTIHVALDQAGYHRCQAVQEGAKSRNITLHFLPPYSPNLNPIERLWKVMNEHVRNNVVFDSLNTFRENIEHFFVSTIPEIKDRLRSRITDNFQTFNTGVSG